MSQFLTIDDAARMLACTPAAIKKWLFQRRLTPVKLGRLVRFRAEDIERIIAQGLPEPGTAHQPRRQAAGRSQEPSSGTSKAESRLEPVGSSP